MKLGWYIRRVSKDYYGFYYTTAIKKDKVECICIWPAEYDSLSYVNISINKFIEFISNTTYGSGSEPDMVCYEEDFYKGFIKIIFSKYIIDEYFLKQIESNIDKIIEKKNEIL